MKRNIKKTIAVLLLTTLAISTVGCGKDEGKQSGVGKYSGENFDAREICEGVTLTIAVPEKQRIADWEESDVTKYIEDTLGVELEFEVYASANFTTKINTMVMSDDDLPDMIMGDSMGSLVQTWGQAGALVELSDYYADPNFAANIQKASEEAGYDIAHYMEDGDGNIYGLPALEQTIGRTVWQRLWIYEPWVKALGAEMPKTIDEYLALCKQVQAKDMNGNGKTNDEIVLAGCGFNSGAGYGDWFEPLMNAFTYAYDDNWWLLDDGKLSVAYTTDEWKEGLTYIKENFFDTGLLDDTVYTNTVENVRANIFGDVVKTFSYVGWQYENGDYKNCVGYKALTGLTDANGENGESMYMPALPMAKACITTDCDNPDAAFLVFDLLCGEQLSITSRYGKEGEDWFRVDENTNLDEYIGTEGYETTWVSENNSLEFWSSTASTTSSYLQVGPYLRTQGVLGRYGLKKDTTTELGKLIHEAYLINDESVKNAYENRREEVFDFAPLTEEERTKVSRKKDTLLDYVTEMTAAFLTGKKDIDKEWDNYLKELDTIGLEEVIETYQEAYDRQH